MARSETKPFTRGTELPANAEEAVGAFLDLAGHQLRNPLSSLKGQAQMLRRRLAKEAGREKDVADLNKILYQVERLEHEFEVYLEAARLQHKRTQVTQELCDLVDVVRRLVEVYLHSASGQSITLDVTDASLYGQWDKRRLHLIVEVLLSNAVRYGQEQEITLRVRQVGAVARIEVEDRGVGVPREERRAIFQPYTTGSNVENAGMGLGLYVARELVRKHHGRLGVRPRRGGGSTFWVELPLTPPEKRGRARTAGEGSNTGDAGKRARVGVRAPETSRIPV